MCKGTDLDYIVLIGVKCVKLRGAVYSTYDALILQLIKENRTVFSWTPCFVLNKSNC